MGKCELCGTEGSRIQVNHQEKGKIMVCRDCWKEVKDQGKKVCDRTSSGGSIGGGCTACR